MKKKNNDVEFELIIKEAEMEMARRHLWDYCKLKSPDFYKEDRLYLKDFCEQLEEFSKSDEDVLICNMPPRHGKSRTSGNMVEWLFGQSINNKIITCSYNNTLSTIFSKSVRNTIQERKADEDKIVYSDLFPNVMIKRGDGACDLWALLGHDTNNYLATSPNGTVTGMGGDFIIIDDLVKNAYEAMNENILEQHWNWFTNTLLSRLEGKRKLILIMTRWSENDLSGRVYKHFSKMGSKIKLIQYNACVDGKMLCEDILSYKNYLDLEKTVGTEIFNANYNNKLIDSQNRLYENFLTYEEVPTFERVEAYIDTADTGSDYLCGFIYGIKNKKAYIIDTIYTQEPMEITEVEVAKKLFDNHVNIVHIESNNGGRGFGRNVERLTRERNNNFTKFDNFTQSKNKISRILSNASAVMLNIYFPYDCKILWAKLMTDLAHYLRKGKNAHDDCADALTGVYEKSLVINSTIKF